jgi:hypothetical protein
MVAGGHYGDPPFPRDPTLTRPPPDPQRARVAGPDELPAAAPSLISRRNARSIRAAEFFPTAWASRVCVD